MRFIETMRVERGRIMNLDLHVDRSLMTIFHHFGVSRRLDFESLIPGNIVDKDGVFKLRVVYSSEIEEFSIEPYTPQIIKSLRVVDGGMIEYRSKYEDRNAIARLKMLKGNCDDILIVKQGFVTDTSFSNIIFSEGDKLFTPTTYLLNGTKRKKMLLSGLIAERAIRVEDIGQYDNCWMINAMLDPTEASAIKCSDILAL